MCIVLAIGSNEQREKHLCYALDQLVPHMDTWQHSPIYNSPAMGSEVPIKGAPAYYNMVIVFDSKKPLATIQELTHHIEQQCHRQREGHYVTLDIDILLFGAYRSQHKGVHIPHPHITKRAYMLRPLADVLPEMTHPDTGLTFKEHWQQFYHSYPQHPPLEPVDFIWREKMLSCANPQLSL